MQGEEDENADMDELDVDQKTGRTGHHTVGGTALRSGSMTAERAHNKDHKIVNFRPACMRACVRACVRASVHACVLTRVRACVE